MSLFNLFISAGKAFSAWRWRERAYAELMALDDRSLVDIGIIHRLQICALVEGARKRTEFPMNNFMPDHQTVLATRQHINSEFVLKNPDAALATMRRPLRSRAGGRLAVLPIQNGKEDNAQLARTG